MAAAATSSSDLINVAEIVDHLITLPIFSGSSLAKRPVVLELYSAARKKFGGKPLVYDAFEKLLGAVEKSNSKTVIITTGFVVPPWIEAETDGPVGASTLARSINLAWDLVPVVVTEPSSVPKMSSLMQFAGLRVKEFSKVKNAPRRSCVEGFTLDAETARREAEKLLARVSPAAVISIEKASPNSKGVFHSGVGVDVSSLSSKVDALIYHAREVGIPTIGVGDAGNEIGMGCIEMEVRELLPTGKDCGCPCHGGVASAVATDSLIVTGTSNWGGAALEALISFYLKSPELLHDGSMEEHLIQKAAELGYINPASGLAEPGVDAIPASVHRSVIKILNFVVKSRYLPSYYLKKYLEFTRDKEKLAKLVKDAEP
jgi:hypothetical protein